jgi:hypothetical protein
VRLVVIVIGAVWSRASDGTLFVRFCHSYRFIVLVCGFARVDVAGWLSVLLMVREGIPLCSIKRLESTSRKRVAPWPHKGVMWWDIRQLNKH